MSETFDLRNQPPLKDIERPEIPSRLSQTFLRHFANCRRSGAFYLQFKGGPGSHEMHRGSAGHLIAERMGRHALEYGEPTVPHEIVREIVNEVVAEPDILIAPGEIDFLHVLGYHFAEALTFDPETIVGLERKVVLEIGDWLIVGKIDLAWVKGDRAGVTDYKTSMNLPDNAAWGPGETDDGKKRIRRFLFQTLLYALLLKYGRPVSVCTACNGTGDWYGSVGADEPRERPCPDCHGEGEIVEDTPLAPRAEYFDLAEVYPAYMYEDEQGVKRLVERKTTITLPELENHRRWLESLVSKVDYAFETGEWPAVPGSHCNECPAQRLCPIPAVLRDRMYAVCERCDGSGEIHRNLSKTVPPDHQLDESMQCPECDGSGATVLIVDSNESARAAIALRERLTADAGQLWDQAKAWADQGNVIVVGDKVYEFTPTTTRSVRKSKGSTDWDGFLAAIDHAAETGEPFDADKWIKETTSTRFTKRSLRPDEDTPDYPEEVDHARRPESDPTDPAARFGDEAPF